LDLFQDHIFPQVAALVVPGGTFDSYTPVFQGDNVGLHQYAAFFNGVTQFCQNAGWHWEPLAPQMLHLNNLDLAVFLAMSKQHSAILSKYSNLVAPAEVIWKTLTKVWEDLELSTKPYGFVLVYSLAEKVIKQYG
jgi:hypothetical protein